MLEYNPTSIGFTVTVGKIIVSEKMKESDGELEIPRSLVSSERQGCMGARLGEKGCRMITPVELIIKLHPDHKKQIHLCMKKLHEMTRDLQSKEGTFNTACCKEVNIKHHKAKDTSDKRNGKWAGGRMVQTRKKQMSTSSQ